MTTIYTKQKNGTITRQNSIEGASTGRFTKIDSGTLPDRCYSCMDVDKETRKVTHPPATGFYPDDGWFYGTCPRCQGKNSPWVQVYKTSLDVADCYTVAITYDGMTDVYGMSQDAHLPNGVNMYIDLFENGYTPTPDESLVELTDLPKGTLKAIEGRVRSYELQL